MDDILPKLNIFVEKNHFENQKITYQLSDKNYPLPKKLHKNQTKCIKKIYKTLSSLPRDFEIWCPVGPVLPHGEKEPL